MFLNIRKISFANPAPLTRHCFYIEDGTLKSEETIYIYSAMGGAIDTLKLAMDGTILYDLKLMEYKQFLKINRIEFTDHLIPVFIHPLFKVACELFLYCDFDFSILYEPNKLKLKF